MSLFCENLYKIAKNRPILIKTLRFSKHPDFLNVSPYVQKWPRSVTTNRAFFCETDHLRVKKKRTLVKFCYNKILLRNLELLHAACICE